MLCRRVAGCVNHRQIGVRCATALCYIPAVDLPWQSDVGEEHVRMMLVIPGEGRFPTLRLDDIESCVEKLSNDQFADKPFVFDNEDLHGSTPFTEVSLASHSHSNDTSRFRRPRYLVALGLISANRVGNLVHAPRLGYEVNVAWQDSSLT